MKESFLKRNESLVIYAIAAIFMVYIHVYGSDENIIAREYIFYGIMIKNQPIEYYLCIVGAICVGLYAFISGYGLCAITQEYESLKKMYIKQFKRLASFYYRFWLVFLLFIPLGIYLGSFVVDRKILIDGILGIKEIALNATWWYVWMYIKILFLFPLFYKLLLYYEQKTINWPRILSIGLVILLILFRAFTTKGQVYLELSFLGCIFCRYDIFGKWDSYLQKTSMKYFIVSVILILESIGFIVFWNPMLKVDTIAVPIFIFCIAEIFRCARLRGFKRLLEILGKYSIYIWLIHGFLVFYYLQPIVIWAKYSLFIWLLSLFISLILGYLVNYLYMQIGKVVSKVKRG